MSRAKKATPKPGKPVERTLSDGTKVLHHHDDTLHLVHDRSPLREKLDARLEENKRRHADLLITHRQRIEAKKTAEATHPTVAAEKRLV